MATAKRVSKDRQKVVTPREIRSNTYIVEVTDGKETRRSQYGTPVLALVYDVTFVDVPDRITLDLSIEEAETLAIIGWATGGQPSGRRGDVDAIKAALKAVGVRHYGGCSYHPDLTTPLQFGPGRTPVTSEQGTAASPIEHKTTSGSTSGRYYGVNAR